MKIRSNQWILLFILVVSVVLRMFNFSEIPFTHDEFSVLSRIHFDSFSALIEHGVKIPDTHPAGVQVFIYYWTKLFGFSTMAMKFPFIVFGVASVYLTYLIGKQWFNETVGLVSAATVTAIQYSVMYSQVARPYISGLLFSLLLVYYLTKLIQNPKQNFLLNGSLFILSGALCAYNHHFSLLFATIVGISGVFFIKKEFLLKYILLGIGIFVLYIPHLNIFFYQLNKGGVEDWLSKPGPDFIFNYISYIFNYSYLMMFVVFGIAISFIVARKSTKINYKLYILFFIWFILPFLIGYFYSVNVNAVLQYSVLIFSFTFILFLIFGHLPNCTPKTNLILVLLIITAGTLSLVFERQHYNYFYKSPYIKILEDYDGLHAEEKNVISIVHSVGYITEYYTEELNIDTNYTWFDDFESIADFKLFIDENAPQYEKLYLGCLHNIDPLAIPIIREYYPTIEIQNNYFGGTTYLFSKAKDQKSVISHLNFEKETQENWGFQTKSLIDTVAFSGRQSYFLDSNEEWGPGYEESIENIIQNEFSIVDVSVKVKSLKPLTGASFVISLELDGELIFWRGFDFDTQTKGEQSNEEWITYHGSMELPKDQLKNKNIRLKTYIWNKEKSEFLIDDFKVEKRKGNEVIYGIVNKL